MSQSAICSAFVRGTSTQDISSLIDQLQGCTPRAVVFFTFDAPRGQAICQALKQRFKDAEVIGCSSAGEFSDQGYGRSGISALALGGAVVKRAASVCLQLDGGVKNEVHRGAAALARDMGQDLRALDPKRYVGVALLEGIKGTEEAVNLELGNVAPLLTFVGGSAADDMKFERTWCFRNHEMSNFGTALLLLEMAVPFAPFKTSSAVPTDTTFTVTGAAERMIKEIDGKPAAAMYAQMVRCSLQQLNFDVFLKNPIAQLIDGKAWLRSPNGVFGTELRMAAAVPEGARCHLMRTTDLVTETRAALVQARQELGSLGGALLFNCAYRRIEMENKNLEAAYHAVLSGFPMAGFHTFGESYLTHVNQTLTGLLVSAPQ